MANQRVPAVGGTHKTLVGTTADTVAVPAGLQGFDAEVFNRHVSEWLWARGDGTAAVAEADGTTAIPPGQSCVIEIVEGQSLSVVGNGNPYSVDHA